ncbi:Xylitol oxidase [Seminavis robusta]|uniref:Xylitol oxidase n=1 Tax=Seminavis robusta TaxID=568900 RepID=A0A9N8HJD5_9STRA|nr:Xylitol oxidase [Seminavis robusta]|eukprot:Sro686_g187080.1 Xylitol oxidase (488) ;mRNA; f:25918-27381
MSSQFANDCGTGTAKDAIDYSQNWSKNIQFHADTVLFPTSVEEVIQIVQNPQYTSIKAFGTRHCFNDIADTAIPQKEKESTLSSVAKKSVHIGMDKMTQIHIILPPSSDDHDDTHPNQKALVQFQAGVTFTQLMAAVEEAGFALFNMPSLPHISVVGGILTGTHGSGIGHGILATKVFEVQVVHANGTVATYDNNTPLLHLGAWGVVVSATMELEPSYHVAKGIYLDLPYSVFLQHIDELLGPSSIQAMGEFTSVFMDWKEPCMSSIWVGKKYDPSTTTLLNRPKLPETLFGGAARQVTPGTQFHPVPGQDPVACIATGYGSWTTKVNHFLPNHPPSSAGNEIQAEFFVPYRHFQAALQALWDHRHVFAHLVQITELRAMAQDNLPLSQAKHETVVGIHFTLFKVNANVLNPILAQVEAILMPFEYKVHWGKWFVARGKQLQQLYDQEDVEELRRLIQLHDPQGRFSNRYIQTCLLEDEGPSRSSRL